MPATINTRPQAIDLDYYPGQAITLTLTFPDTYLDTRAFKAYLGGRTTPGVELTCTEEPDTVTLTITADAADTVAFDFPAQFTLVPFTAPSTYGDPIFVGTWTPGTEGQAVTAVAEYVVRTPDEIAVTVNQYTGATGATGPTGPSGDDGVIQSVVAGTGITVDNTDPANPIITATAADPVLALCVYNPASVAQYAVTSSFADIDATNLAVTFTVPSTGAVLITGQITSVAGANGTAVNLREGSSDLVGTEQVLNDQQGASIYLNCNFAMYISGLTPAASKTYKLGACGNTNIANALRVGGRGTTQIPGPAFIKVTAVP